MTSTATRGNFGFVLFGLAVVGSVVAAGACQRLRGPTPDRHALAASEPVTPPVPIPNGMLDQIHTANGGLLKGLRPDGLPLTEGPNTDPLIEEARRYYETIGIPNIVGQPPRIGAGAPDTLADWKQALGFPTQLAGEDRAAFRRRTGAVV